MTTDEKKVSEVPVIEGSQEEIVAAIRDGVVVNASGYRDQLKRQYSLVGLAGVALTVDNAWVALGSSISVSIRELLPSYPSICFGPFRIDRASS
jgi:choline transport protein